MLPSQPIFEPTFLNLEYLFYKILEFFQSVVEFLGAGFFADLYFWLKVIASLAAILFIVVIIFSILRIKEIKQAEHEKLKNVKLSVVPSVEKNEKWEKVKEHIKSENPADWRLAIIEADTILDEMVINMGYDGENLGERLKRIEPSDFLTLNDAWEAHKVRNRIAHEGSNFELSHHEAKRVIALYERVFREFKYI